MEAKKKTKAQEEEQQRMMERLRQLRATKPKTDDELHYWVKTFLGVDIPRTRICPHHQAPFEAFADAYFARAPVSVWKASRGFGGKTFLAALLSLTEAITLGASISILGGSMDQSLLMQAYLNNSSPRARGKFWEAPLAPTHMILGRPTKGTLVLKNGGQAIALAASQTRVRGRHPHRLRIDEADSAELEIIQAALGQTMGGDGVTPHTLISSTHQNPDGPMTWALQEAEEKGWHCWEWCYKESMQPHGWLDPAEVERKRIEVPHAMWQIEYENQEPAPEGRVFTKEVLENLFDPSLGVFEGAVGEDIIVIPPKYPRPEPPPLILPDDHFYNDDFTTGTDWGKAQDFTVIHTMKKNRGGPDMLAAWGRFGKEPWPRMVDRHNERIRRYGGYSIHDATGVGSVMDELLTVPSEGFDFNRRKEKADMYSSYVKACEAGEIVYPMIKPLYRAHKYLTVDQLYHDKHTPDEIVAAALERKARMDLAWEVLIFGF